MTKVKLIREEVQKTSYIEVRKVYPIITKRGDKTNGFVDEKGKWWVYDLVKSTYRPVESFHHTEHPEFYYREVPDYDNEVKELLNRLNYSLDSGNFKYLEDFRPHIKDVHSKIFK